jgi:hypothetical protein
MDYFPLPRHGIFINSASRDDIKFPFLTNISLKTPNPTRILDPSRKTGTGLYLHSEQYYIIISIKIMLAHVQSSVECMKFINNKATKL